MSRTRSLFNVWLWRCQSRSTHWTKFFFKNWLFDNALVGWDLWKYTQNEWTSSFSEMKPILCRNNVIFLLYFLFFVFTIFNLPIWETEIQKISLYTLYLAPFLHKFSHSFIFVLVPDKKRWAKINHSYRKVQHTKFMRQISVTFLLFCLMKWFFPHKKVDRINYNSC